MTLDAIPKPFVHVASAVVLLLLLQQLGFFRRLGAGAAGAAGDLVGGAVEGVGEQFGIPVTNMTECERAKAEGRTLDASFACTAKDFLGYVFGDDDPPGVRSRTRNPE